MKPASNKAGPVKFPDFRNLGVIARALVLAEGLRFLFVWVAQGAIAAALQHFIGGAPLYEITLIGIVSCLIALSPFLQQLQYQSALGATLFMVVFISLGIWAAFARGLGIATGLEVSQAALTAILVTGAILFYFDWRQRTLSPSLSEARLSALQARIRPHFLFNSLNTVLGLMRSDPRRAEAVLENLSELFRALMSDTRALVPLQRELELAKAYAEIESLRLGERLRVMWHDEGAPLTAQVPQLILQPLLENAVLHGIEPSPQGGEIHVNIFTKAGNLVIVIRNPLLASAPKREGNHMALANIRERLDLHFDAEARMTHYTAGGEFVVQLELPAR